jgi:hypothetical protein
VIRPLTCVCLILAAGSGLYLYQVKQRAFALDASLRSTFHDIDAARERTRMLRADWALVNDPERLQVLASQYLKLQPMQPSQLLTMDQLAAALPSPAPFPAPVAAAPFPAPVAAKPAPVVDPTRGLPMAEMSPQGLPPSHPAAPQVALLQPVAPPLVMPPLAAPPVAVTMPVSQPADVAVAAPPKPARHVAHHAASEAQAWAAHAAGSQVVPRRHPDRHATPQSTPASRQFYAANVAQRGADAAPRLTPEAATVMYRPASGSSLGMASSATLAPPRPLYSTSQ